MIIHPGDKIQTTIGSTAKRRGVIVEAKEVQTGIDERDVQVRGQGILVRGGYGKRHYVVDYEKIKGVIH